MRQVEYQPPEKEAVYEYVHNLCNGIAARGDRSYTWQEVMDGLADFLCVVGEIESKRINDTQEQPAD